VGVIATLRPSAVSVVPGQEATCELRLRNTGTIVDQFSVEVLGDAAGWATAEPDQISLFPDDEGLVTLRFRPPRTGEVVAGQLVFGVKASSGQEPDSSVVEEGTIEVLPFAEVTAELIPRTTRGRRGAVHELAVDNRGNAPVTAAVSAVDDGDQLLFDVAEPTVSADADTATFVRIKVRPKKRFRRGPNQTRPFNVVVEPEGGTPILLPASFLQEPTVPKWLPRALLIALAALLLLVLLWYALLRPTIRSAAKEAVRDEQTTPSTLVPPGGGDGGGNGQDGEGEGDGGAEVSALGNAVNGRLFLTASGTAQFEVPADRILQLTDLVLQNPNGDSGRLQVRRGDTVLLVVELSNFRDLDYHFVAPVVFTASETLVISAECTSESCTPGMYFAGFLVEP
jgi:hypothetical protein